MIRRGVSRALYRRTLCEPRVANCSVEVRLVGAKPAGECGFFHRALDLADSMFQCVGDSEHNGVTETCIPDFVENLARSKFPQLEGALYWELGKDAA